MNSAGSFNHKIINFPNDDKEFQIEYSKSKVSGWKYINTLILIIKVVHSVLQRHTNVFLENAPPTYFAHTLFLFELD